MNSPRKFFKKVTILGAHSCKAKGQVTLENMQIATYTLEKLENG